jgi:hypothetical protein
MWGAGHKVLFLHITNIKHLGKGIQTMKKGINLLGAFLLALGVASCTYEKKEEAPAEPAAAPEAAPAAPAEEAAPAAEAPAAGGGEVVPPAETPAAEAH